MADIDIQKKSAPNWIWWAVGGLLLAVLVVWLLTGVGRDQVAMVDQPAVMEPIPAPMEVDRPLPAQVQAYQENCAPAQPAAMGLDHQSTSECLRQLADAVGAVLPADRRAAVETELANARDAAQQLAASAPDAVNHSAMARDGATSIASALETAQRQWYPDLSGDVQEVSRAANAVATEVALLEQRDRVQQFFSQAGRALDRMARS